MQNKRRLFTLIELIVVIVVLGILAVIVIPNVSNIKDEANTVAVKNNIKSIQTAIDKYNLDHDKPPIFSNDLKVGDAGVINYTELAPKYLHDIPKVGNYWINHEKVVFGSTSGLPENIVAREGEISWNSPDNSEGYNIYTDNSMNSKANKELTFVEYLEEDGSGNYSVTGKQGNLFVSSIDKHGNETPAVNTSDTYNNSNGSEVGNTNKFVEIYSGDYHNVGLREDGSVHAWGNNVRNQVTGAPKDKNIQQIVVGAYANAILREDGSIYVWGHDYFGDGPNKNIPNTNKGKFVKIDISATNGVALREDGTVAVWGGSLYGDIDLIPTEGKYIDIYTEHDLIILVKENGDALAWGYKGYTAEEGWITHKGQKVNIEDYVYYDEPLYDWASIQDGKIVVNDDKLHFRVKAENETHYVKDIPKGNDFIKVSTGIAHGVAIKSDGTYVEWGKTKYKLYPPV